MKKLSVVGKDYHTTENVVGFYNAGNEALISTDASRVAVRVIRTDEERIIAKTVCRVLDLGMGQ